MQLGSEVSCYNKSFTFQVLRNDIKECVNLMIAELKNLRSQVCRAAALVNIQLFIKYFPHRIRQQILKLRIRMFTKYSTNLNMFEKLVYLLFNLFVTSKKRILQFLNLKCCKMHSKYVKKTRLKMFFIAIHKYELINH